MLDLRDPPAVVRRLDDALRSFERGGGVPVGVRELLREFAQTLATSTPYESGLWPESWELASERTARGVEGLDDDRPEVQCREAK